MSFRFPRWLILPSSLLVFASVATAQDAPPVAAIVPKVDTLNGEVRVDNYFYLRDRQNPLVIPYIEAENAYTESRMAHTQDLQEKLYKEMLARIKETDLSVPERRGPYLYYTRTEQGKSYPIFSRRRGSKGAEQVIFDQNAEAAGTSFYQLGGFQVSPDHNLLAVLVDTNGHEDFELQVKDLRSGQFLEDRIPRLTFGLAWASDNRTIFYMTTDSAKRGDQVWRHRLGTPPSEDVSVYHDSDVLFNVSVSRSRSGRYIYLSSGSFTSGETWVVAADHPDAAPRLIAARQPDVEYDVTDSGDRFFITTNGNGARNFAVMQAPAADPSPANWTPFIPYRDSVFVEGVDAFKDWVVVSQRSGGLRRLQVTRLRTGAGHSVSFPEAAYGVFPAENPEFDTPLYRFTYTSLVTPNSVYDYNLMTHTRRLLKRDPVLGGYDPAKYTVERLMATARDGTRVPISLVYRKPLVRNGKRPLLLYAYGSYGATIEPTFSSIRFSLIDRGFTYAIAHIRGGQEMGRQWYDDGKMMHKKNTFFDFIDCAEYLVQAGYTSPDRLVANGGSAGGLLMGAITNFRPDLFHAVVADVPFVDLINTMLDASIPLTAQEWLQWGNPYKADEYAYMKTYAPYENVESKAYPALLVTSSLNDSRVPYWEPTKWVAKLRALKTDDHLLLLKMNMGAGHGGSSGRYDRLHDQAFRYAFIIDQVQGAPSP